ncbi:MAG: hypothetical protein AAF823_09110 [Planctomycetota bacterium]
MPATPPIGRPFPLGRAAAVMAAALLPLAGLAAAIALLLGEPRLAAEAALTAAGCLVVGVVALMPIALMVGTQGPAGVVPGFLASTTLRLAACLLFAVAAWRLLDSTSLPLWVMGWYLVVLVVEVHAVATYNAKAAPTSAPAADTAADQSPA